jgi:hypothetical protein
MIDTLAFGLFKLLAISMGVLLSCQAVIRAYGQIAFLVLLVITIAVCIEIRTWLSRLITAFLIFFVIPAALAFAWTRHPILFLAVMIGISITAYVIRESRLPGKLASGKSGAERTPVFPPGRDAE